MDSNFLAHGKSTNGTGRSSAIHDNNSHSSGSRRSACDRCRAHKLRCVRPLACDFTEKGVGIGLPACERCVKAGFECLHTVRTRQTSIRSSGYERRGSTRSASPSIVHQQPANDTVPPAGGGHLYQDTSSRPIFRTTPTQCSEEGRAAITNFGDQHNMTRDEPRRKDNPHCPTNSESSSVDLSAISGDFRAMVSVGVDASVDSDPGCSSIPYNISDHDLGMPAQFASLSHWPECDFSMSQIFDQDLSGHVGSTKTSAPVVESKKDPKAARGRVMTEQCTTKHECLQRLTEQTSFLLEYFGLTEDRAIELEDLLAYPPSGRARAPEVHEESETGKNMIGVLLESSQIFLETLERLKNLQTPRHEKQSSCSSPNSEYSYIDSPDEMDVFSNEGTSTTQEALPTIHKRTDRKINRDEIDDLLKSPETLHCHDQKAAVAPSMLSRQQSVSFSIPTTFTIISCYMWLFRGYEVVFATIHKALRKQRYERSQRTQESTNQQHGSEMGPAILPDINIGGFGLNCHPHLQIEMLVHINCQMLQRIEAVMGINPASRESCTNRTSLTETQNGVLNLTSVPTLLHTFLHGADSGSGGGSPSSARISFVRGMVKSIHHTLRSGRE